ncbi:universal stress protein [Pseudomonas sp. NW5]|uniref:universal stress protein n=1 Tax=Pseudomonas sp. NW5 TaxID=2934934 RepID=UPI00201FD0A6|nr:universal stress protein [Pseudomonas sp. NW5]MCL7463154.1 universal stress protein [Pseudomonas sp. NW5]
MSALHTLLAMTDFSSPAEAAALRAARLARQCGARLQVQHVLARQALQQLQALFGLADTALGARLTQDAHEQLHALAARLQAETGVSAGLHLSQGVVLDELLDYSDACDAGLVVVGAQGQGLIRELTLGSTAERLLRKSNRPLLTVRGAVQGDYQHILLPVDFSPRTERALALLRQLAPEAHLTLLHVFSVPFEGMLRHAGVEESQIIRLREEVRQRAAQSMEALRSSEALQGRSVDSVLLGGDPALQVLQQANLRGSELIAMGRRGQGVLDELLLGSVTKHVIAHAHCDVLVL